LSQGIQIGLDQSSSTWVTHGPTLTSGKPEPVLA